MRSSSPEVVISDTSPRRATIRLRGWPVLVAERLGQGEIAVSLLAATHRAHLHVHGSYITWHCVPSVNHLFVTTLTLENPTLSTARPGQQAVRSPRIEELSRRSRD